MVLLVVMSAPTLGRFAEFYRTPVVDVLLGRGSTIGLSRAMTGPARDLAEASFSLFGAGLIAWLSALAFWVATGLLALVIAARRHQEW